MHVLTFIEALGEARLKAAQCACTVQVCRENSKTVVGSLSETDAANEFSIIFPPDPPDRSQDATRPARSRHSLRLSPGNSSSALGAVD